MQGEIWKLLFKSSLSTSHFKLKMQTKVIIAFWIRNGGKQMELGNIKASQEKVARRRVGRGIGSGLGKTRKR